MRLEKQIIVMSILDTGKRKRGRIKLNTNLLPTGYRQLTLFKGRGTGVKAIVYLHQIVYMAKNGMFPDGWEIDHVDRDKQNNAHWNLEAKTTKGNCANKLHTKCPDTLKLIRRPEIADIRQLHSNGNSQASIAKQLDLNRLSVRYIIKRIEAGLPLKYE